MRKIRKTVLFLLIFCIVLAQVPGMKAGAEWALPSGVSLTANAVYLINADTGTVIYSQNADQKAYPASITKLMTAILTAEKFDTPDKLGTMVTVEKSDIAPLQGTGSSLMGAGLKAGEQLTVEQLLYGMLLPSGNDAAMVLARVVGGDVSNFAKMMNEKAQEIGCKGTHYVNPHGLTDPQQYTTAKDTYLIAKYAMAIPELATVVDTARKSIDTSTTHYTLLNTNKMISSSNYYYKHTQIVKGIKTGSTSDAGDCLVSYATYKGSTYYCVVMGCQKVDNVCTSAFKNTMPLYTWAFGGFGVENLVEKNSMQATVPLQLAWDKSEIKLVAAGQFNALIPNGTDVSKSVKLKMHVPKSVMAPVAKGQKLGTADIMLNGQKLGTIDLISNESVSRSQPLYFVYIAGKFFHSLLFKVLCVVLILLLAAFFTLSFLHNRSRKRRNKRRKVYRLPR